MVDLCFCFVLNATKCQKYNISLTQVRERYIELDRSGQTELKNEHDNRNHILYIHNK